MTKAFGVSWCNELGGIESLLSLQVRIGWNRGEIGRDQRDREISEGERGEIGRDEWIRFRAYI